MIQLFKAKSLKSNTKQGTGVSAGVRGVGAKLTSSLNERTQEKEKSKGRSMVEMLGVLAIIGVLSIGGIQGYTLAMRKYRANEILNIVQKYAMVLYSGCRNAMNNNPKKYYINSNGYGYSRNFWFCPNIPFVDAGLGALPSGVLKIGGNGDMLYSSARYDGDANIKSLSSGDAVVISVKFETQELCETVMGITGKAITDNYALGAVYRRSDDQGSDYRDYDPGDNTCGKKGTYYFSDDYYLSIVTMMN